MPPHFQRGNIILLISGCFRWESVPECTFYLYWVLASRQLPWSGRPLSSLFTRSRTAVISMTPPPPTPPSGARVPTPSNHNCESTLPAGVRQYAGQRYSARWTTARCVIEMDGDWLVDGARSRQEARAATAPSPPGRRERRGLIATSWLSATCTRAGFVSSGWAPGGSTEGHQHFRRTEERTYSLTNALTH